MNPEIEKYTRDLVYEKLLQTTDDQFMVFKRMYSHKDLEANKVNVAAKMDITKTDYALVQLNNQITKNIK